MFKFKRHEGDISTVVASIIGVMMLITIFYQYFFIHLDIERYNILNQYARDILLVCETKEKIDGNYIKTAKNDLQKKLVKKDGEYVKVYINIDDTSFDSDNMGIIKTDFGETIEVLIEYYYYPQRLDFSKNLVPSRKADNLEIMGTKLQTISKNRGTSDG